MLQLHTARLQNSFQIVEDFSCLHLNISLYNFATFRIDIPSIGTGLRGIASAGGQPIPGGLASTDMVFWGAGHGLQWY